MTLTPRHGKPPQNTPATTPQKLGEADQQAAIRLVQKGMSVRAVAKRFGISAPTLTRYIERARAEGTSPDRHTGLAPEGVSPALRQRLAARAAEPEPAPPPELDAVGALAEVRRLMLESRSQIDDARRMGDYQQQQRATRNSAALASVLARLERAEKSSADAIVIPRADHTKAMASVLEKAQAFVREHQHQYCAGCGAELRASWGGVKLGAPADPAAAAHR